MMKIAQGEYIGIMIDSLQKEKFKSGQVIATPGLIEPHTQFKCELYIYTKAEGGSVTLKYLHNGAKLSFDFWTTKIRGEISISKSVKKVNPGESLELFVKLEYSIALKKDLKFTFRKDNKIIGKGIITQIMI